MGRTKKIYEYTVHVTFDGMENYDMEINLLTGITPTESSLDRLELTAKLAQAAPELLEALQDLSKAVQALRDGKRDGASFGRVSVADDFAKQVLKKVGA